MRFTCDVHHLADRGSKTMIIALTQETARELEFTLDNACRVRIDRYVDTIFCFLFDYFFCRYDIFIFSCDASRILIMHGSRIHYFLYMLPKKIVKKTIHLNEQLTSLRSIVFVCFLYTSTDFRKNSSNPHGLRVTITSA